MIVLSLFDGMSCGQIAFERAGIKVDKYYASEIDKYAIQITQKNYPGTFQLGDVTKWRSWRIEKPDIIIGGSPCQGFSFAGKQLNFDDPRSALFYTFVDILRYYTPEFFLLENVKMKLSYQAVISALLGRHPIKINSALVSAQTRKRLYWTNIPGAGCPIDRGVVLPSILDTAGMSGNIAVVHTNMSGIKTPHYDKSCALRANASSKYLIVTDGNVQRALLPVECERLQTVPEGYTYGVSTRQRAKMLGNGWTVDVIAHLFGGLKHA